MSCCVYKHTAPNGKCYIGITSTSLKRRCGNGSGYYKNEYFTKAIKKYGWENFTHEILFDNLEQEEAERIERELIKKYSSNDKRFGYNITDGGEKCKRHAQSSKEKMSKAKKGKYAGEKSYWYGKHRSEETKMKLHNALSGKMSGDKNPNYGKPLSNEQKKKIGESRTGKHYPKLAEAIKNSPICIANREKTMKPIMQFTKDGEFVREWKSAPDASEFLLGHRRGQSNICSCANGVLKSAYGFIWKYQNC